MKKKDGVRLVRDFEDAVIQRVHAGIPTGRAQMTWDAADAAAQAARKALLVALGEIPMQATAAGYSAEYVEHLRGEIERLGQFTRHGDDCKKAPRIEGGVEYGSELPPHACTCGLDTPEMAATTTGSAT